MDDAGVVRRFQRIDDLPRNRECLVDGHRAPRDVNGEVLALDQLHDQSVALNAIDGRDVRMIEGGERLGFAREAQHTIRVRGEQLGKDLQRDVAIELRIAGAIDLAHAAFAQRADDLVRSDGLPWRQAHEGAAIILVPAAARQRAADRRLSRCFTRSAAR